MATYQVLDATTHTRIIQDNGAGAGDNRYIYYNFPKYPTRFEVKNGYLNVMYFDEEIKVPRAFITTPVSSSDTDLANQVTFLTEAPLSPTPQGSTSIGFIGSDVNWDLPQGATYEVAVPLSGAYDTNTAFATDSPDITINIQEWHSQGVVLQVIIPIAATLGSYELEVISGDYSNKDLTGNLSTNAVARFNVIASGGDFAINGNDVTEFQKKLSKKTLFINSYDDFNIVGSNIILEDATRYVVERILPKSAYTFVFPTGGNVILTGYGTHTSGIGSTMTDCFSITDCDVEISNLYIDVDFSIFHPTNNARDKELIFKNNTAIGQLDYAALITGFSKVELKENVFDAFFGEFLFVSCGYTKVYGNTYRNWDDTADTILVDINSPQGTVSIERNIFQVNGDAVGIKGGVYPSATDLFVSNNIFTGTADQINRADDIDGILYPNQVFVNNIGIDDNPSTFPTTSKIINSLNNLLSLHPPNPLTPNKIELGNFIYNIGVATLNLQNYYLYIGAGVNAAIKGESQNINKITSAQNGVSAVDKYYSIVVENTNLFLDDLQLEVTGTNAECIKMDGTGVEGLDMQYVEMAGTKMGTLTDIRQAYWANGFSFGASDGFTLDGNITGGFTLFNSRIINCQNAILGAGATLLLGADAAIRSNVNATIPAASVAFDFDYANFTADNSYQLDGCKFNGSGLAVSAFTTGDTTITQDSVKSYFTNNSGTLAVNTVIQSSYSVTAQAATTLTLNNPVVPSGTITAGRNSHWEVVTPTPNFAQRCLDSQKRWYRQTGQFVVEGSGSDLVGIQVIHYDGVTTVETLLREYERTLLNVPGTGVDRAYFVFDTVFEAIENDEIRIKIVNKTDNDNLTILDDSYTQILTI